MIEKLHEYEVAKRELVQLEDWLDQLYRDHATSARGQTRLGLLKKIARIQKDLGVFEAELSISTTKIKHRQQLEMVE